MQGQESKVSVKLTTFGADLFLEVDVFCMKNSSISVTGPIRHMVEIS
jgi:hypothetical protein